MRLTSWLSPLVSLSRPLSGPPPTSAIAVAEIGIQA